jgi:hypothetical protein
VPGSAERTCLENMQCGRTCMFHCVLAKSCHAGISSMVLRLQPAWRNMPWQLVCDVDRALCNVDVVSRDL